MPIAIANDMVVAIALSDDETIHLHHTEGSTYASVVVDPKNIAIDARKHLWSNYFLAGVKGILDHAKTSQPRGCYLMVHGNVPIV